MAMLPFLVYTLNKNTQIIIHEFTEKQKTSFLTCENTDIRVVPIKGHFSRKGQFIVLVFRADFFCFFGDGPKNHQTKRIAEAIQEELSKGVSLKNGCAIISKREGMTSAAVKKCYQRCFSHPTKNHGNETLTIDQKTILTSMILAFSGCNLPLTLQQVKTTASFLFDISIADSTLYCWLNSFKSQIKQKKTKVLSKKRMDP
jgi:hypothetical protein